MTIRPGEPWGDTIARPGDLFVVSSDADLASHLGASAAGARPVGVDGGDLHRSLGAPGRRDQVQRLPLDLLHVTADGRRHVAVAHVVMRRRWPTGWWRGRIVAVMNVDRIGALNVAPRAHPNDGRFDIVEVDAAMSVRQRLQARTRLRHGTHVPHEAITVRRATRQSWNLAPAMQLWIDGVPRGSASSVEVSIVPDAATVHV
jgi:hypothetical protein